jgi:hypothetical protein
MPDEPEASGGSDADGTEEDDAEIDPANESGEDAD